MNCVTLRLGANNTAEDFLRGRDEITVATVRTPATRSPVLPADVKLRAGRKPGGRPEGLPHNGCAAAYAPFRSSFLLELPDP